MPPILAFVAGPLGRYLIAGVALFLVMITVFHRGMLHERAGWEARRAHAVAEARTTEHSAAALGNSAERAALAAAITQKENADAELTVLRAQLARLPRCAVPRTVVRLLDGVAVGVPAITGTAAGTLSAPAHMASDPAAGRGLQTRPAGSAALQTAAADAGATVDAAAVLDNCAWNRLNVAEPNARHIEQLQHYYASLRNLFNQP